jgi:signal peptide peptidase SppA
MQHNQLPDLLAIHQAHLEPLVTKLRNNTPTQQQSDAAEKTASLNLFRNGEDAERPYELLKTTAIIPLRGYLTKRSCYWWGCTGYDYFADLIRLAVADFAVDNIVIDCDSPGGEVRGCADCADVVFQSAKIKPITVVVNDLCASAALWVASAGSQIVITQLGDMGSIGVMRLRFDYTRQLEREGIGVEVFRAGAQKAFGSPYLPLTDAERKVGQADVDTSYDSFISAVARNRRVDESRVRNDWADARMFVGQQAVDVGLADRVASFDQVLADLVGRQVITGDSDDGREDSYPTTPTSTRRAVGYVRRR